MNEHLPGTLISVTKEHLQNVDGILDPMFLMEGMQLRQVTQLLGIEAHTVQNWVKRKFVESPVNKFYNRDRFVRLAILNYFKDVFSLEGILELLKMANQDNEVYSAFCALLAAAPVDPMAAAIEKIRQRSKHLSEPNVMSDEAIGKIKFFDDED